MNEKNKKALIAGIGLTAVILLGIVLYTNFQNRRRAEDAWSSLASQASTALDGEEKQIAQDLPREDVQVSVGINLSPDVDWSLLQAFVIYASEAGETANGGYPSNPSMVEKRMAWSDERPAVLIADRLPVREEYLVAIWNDRGYVARTLTRGDDRVIELVDVNLQSPTGIALTVNNPSTDHESFAVRLKRDMASRAEDEDAWRYLLWKTNPDLFASYDWMPEEDFDGPRKLITDGLNVPVNEKTILSPLIPDSSVDLELVTLAGDAMRTRQVELRSKEIVDVLITIEREESAGAKPCVDVTGTILREDDNRPIAGAKVIWADAELAYHEDVTDDDGRFKLECLPLEAWYETGQMHGTEFEVVQSEDGRISVEPMDRGHEGHDHGHAHSEFRIVPPKPEVGLSPYPAEVVFDLTLEALFATEANVTWKIPQLHWIQAHGDLSEIKKQAIEDPYPIYTLQRWNAEEETWETDCEVEQGFLQDGIRFGVEREGEYRAAVLLAPLQAIYTDTVELNTTSGSADVEIPSYPVEGTDVEIRFVSGHDGQPFPGVEFHLSAQNSCVPIRTLSANSEGLFLAKSVNVWPIMVKIGRGSESQTISISEMDASSPVEISVTAP